MERKCICVHIGIVELPWNSRIDYAIVLSELPNRIKVLPHLFTSFLYTPFVDSFIEVFMLCLPRSMQSWSTFFITPFIFSFALMISCKMDCFHLYHNISSAWLNLHKRCFITLSTSDMVGFMLPQLISARLEVCVLCGTGKDVFYTGTSTVKWIPAPVLAPAQSYC